MQLIEHPKAQSQFLRTIVQGNLINAWLGPGAKLKMKRAVGSNEQGLAGSYHLTAVERFRDNGVAGFQDRISHRDIDNLIGL